MRKTHMGKILLRQLFFSFIFLCSMLSVHASRTYKIGVIHSYEKSYHDADRYRYILEQELRANGVKFEINELFLNCDELRYHTEMARASFFIDELTKWGPILLPYSIIKLPIPF